MKQPCEFPKSKTNKVVKKSVIFPDHTIYTHMSSRDVTNNMSSSHLNKIKYYIIITRVQLKIVIDDIEI